MAKKAIVELELQTDSYKASLVEIQKGNTTISESASKAAQTAQAAFIEVGKSATQAFASNEVKKALVDQSASIDRLKASLEKLYQEEVRLLAEGKKQTAEFKQNQVEADKLRKSLDGLSVSTDETANSFKMLIKNGQDLAKFEDRLRELSLAGDRSSDEFKDLAKAIGTYKASITAADRAVDLYAKSTDAATGRIGELEDKLYDLALAGKANTQEFKDLVKEVAVVKRAIQETDAQVDNLSQRGRAFATLSQNVELVGVAFQAVEGAQAAFGSDSEELQKTLVKLNAIIAITSALEQGRQIILEQLAAKTGLVAAAQKVYSFVTTGATAATKAWRAALVATGIGAVVAILGTLASKFMDVGEATDEAAEKAREYQKALEELQRGAQSAQLRFGNARIEQLRLEGKLTDEQAKRLTALNDVNQAIINNNVAAKEKEAEAFKRFEEQKLEDVKMFGKLSRITTEQLNKDLNNIEAERALNERAIRLEAQNELLKSQEKSNKATKDSTKDTKERRIEIELLTDELIKQNQAELANLESLIKLSDIEDSSTATRLRTRLNFLNTLELNEGTSLNRRIDIITKEGDLRKQQAIEGIDDAKERATAIELIEAETQAAIRTERKKTLDESVNLAFQYAQEFAKVLSALNDLSRQTSENTISEIQQRQSAELEAINNTLNTERQKERQRAALTLRTNQQIALEKQKQAKRDKALAIFEATINTAASIVKTGASLGYPAAIPFQVAAGIVGAAQIATIAARPIPRFEKGGKVGGKRHSQGGTLIEAEVDEFVTRRGQSIRHRSELEAINRSTAEYHRLIQRNYVRPAIARVLADRKQDKPTFNLNATLNSKKMEGELKGLRKDIRRSKQRNYTNQTDSRYQWHNN